MKRILMLALLLNCVVCGLFGQKKKEIIVESIFSIMSGYTTMSSHNAVPLTFEYQYKFKNFALGVGLSGEYEAYKYGSINRRLYEVGVRVRDLGPGQRSAYQSSEKWLNIAPSLLGYYFIGQKKKLEGFFKTGVVANYNAYYSYKGYEYRTDLQGLVVDIGPIYASETKTSIDLQSINWLIGGGVQYKLNKKTAFRLVCETQWARGLSLLGGICFKI